MHASRKEARRDHRERQHDGPSQVPSAVATFTCAPRRERGLEHLSLDELRVPLGPRAEDPADLVAKAQRDCFVGASLTIEPDYTWRVS